MIESEFSNIAISENITHHMKHKGNLVNLCFSFVHLVDEEISNRLNLQAPD